MSRRHRILTAGIALLVALNVVACTGLIPSWGYWYSGDLNFRRQTDALLEGRVAVGDNPAELAWDWAWWDGGAQQVWGLAVPAWRFPFEFAARTVGKQAFPDRLALAAAMAATMYVLASQFWPPRLFLQPISTLIRRPAAVMAPLTLISFPPFLSLCATRFWVYEEAQAYAFLAALTLIGLTLGFARRPSFPRGLTLCLISGLTGFVRPTLLAYGGASLAIVLIKARSARWSAWRMAAMTIAFGVGIAVLGISNTQRFGSWLEFGHRINVNGIDRMRYASRFDDPFADEPLASASLELFSSLFLAGNSFNGDRWYATRFFPGQSTTLRWREFYFTTFGLGTLAMFAAACFWATIRISKHGVHDLRRAARAAPLALTLWSIIGAIPLFFFYLRCPFIASRYLLDFAPSFAGTWVAGLFAMQGVLPSSLRSRPRYVGLLLFCVIASWCYAIGTSRILVDEDRRFPPQQSLTLQQLSRRMDGRTIPHFETPNVYEVGVDLDRYGQFNGAGWSEVDGRTKSAAIFVLRNPLTIQLEVAPAANDSVDYSIIRARAGLVELRLQSTTPTASGARLTFVWPADTTPPRGEQILFVGLVAPRELERTYSQFRILRVTWEEAT